MKENWVIKKPDSSILRENGRFESGPIQFFNTADECRVYIDLKLGGSAYLCIEKWKK